MRRSLIATALLVLVLAAARPLLPSPIIPAAAQSDPVAACQDLLADYVPVMGMDRYPTPVEMPLPSVREAWRDPAFGTCMIRVTDRLNDFGLPLTGLKNEYSRVQSFNADGSLLIARSVEGDWYLYDARTLSPLQKLDTGMTLDEPRWDASDPLRFVFSPWGDGLDPAAAELVPAHGRFQVQVSAGPGLRANLPPEWNAAVIWRRWEGSPSLDSRYDAFLAEDENFITRGLVTYDWQTGQILGRYTVPRGDLNEPDNVSMSPLGNYVLAQFEYCDKGTLGTYEQPCGAMIFTRDLSQGWSVARIIGHSDLALDTEGREVVVYSDSDEDQIVMTDLESGQTTMLLALDFSTGVYGMHFSGRAFRVPGWVAISVQPEAPSLDFNNPFWMVGTIFALELKASPRVIQLAHHHSIRSDSDADYFAEPQVTVNPDFTRLLFTSNWGSYGNGEVEMYMIVLPDGWLDHLPRAGAAHRGSSGGSTP